MDHHIWFISLEVNSVADKRTAVMTDPILAIDGRLCRRERMRPTEPVSDFPDPSDYPVRLVA